MWKSCFPVTDLVIWAFWEGRLLTRYGLISAHRLWSMRLLGLERSQGGVKNFCNWSHNAKSLCSHPPVLTWDRSPGSSLKEASCSSMVRSVGKNRAEDWSTLTHQAYPESTVLASHGAFWWVLASEHILKLGKEASVKIHTVKRYFDCSYSAHHSLRRNSRRLGLVGKKDCQRP